MNGNRAYGENITIGQQLGLLKEIRDVAAEIIKKAIKDGDPWYHQKAQKIRESVRLLLPD